MIRKPALLYLLVAAVAIAAVWAPFVIVLGAQQSAGGAGELPHEKPPRPQGVERSIVVTTWEWGDPKKYLHDLIASDRQYPTVNAYGKLVHFQLRPDPLAH